MHSRHHGGRDPERHAGHQPAHDRHEGHSVAMFRNRFWGCLALTLPTLAWGHMLTEALGWHPPRFPGSVWVAPVFATAVFLYGGQPFLSGARTELASRRPGMMTLIALAISVAFLFSVAVMVGVPGKPLWEELATLVTVMLLGHWIEMRSITQAQGALRELAKLLPTMATRLHGEHAEEVPIADLRQGDLVLVRPGGGIPADGTVELGRSSVTEAMITGESAPVPKEEGARVIAGTLNGNGSLRIRVTGIGEGTALAGIMRLVEAAQASKSSAQALADRAAFILTIVALVSGAATLVAWLFIRRDSPAWAVERAVTVLVIACPHALGLAIPLVIAISTTLGARNGLLVKNRKGLEEARLLDTVVFDKTGTLTLGEMRVVNSMTDGLGQADALALAAAVEGDSEHPIARAVVRSAREQKVAIPGARDFRALPGRGAQAEVGSRTWYVGGPALLEHVGVTPGDPIEALTRSAAADGQAVAYLTDGTHVAAGFAVADAIRPESREAVDQLHAAGVRVVLLTGDVRPVADAVARTLGIDEVRAQVLPDGKAAVIDSLRAGGRRVAMVGDGVNDAPALATADVGIAIGTGTDVAVEAGDVVLIRSDPRDVPRIITLSRATFRKMLQNLAWATGYNVVAIPLAAGVLASRGLVLSPAAGAVLMSLSTVAVAVNAQLLRRTRL